MSQVPDIYFTVAQVAVMIGMSEKWTRAAVKEGQFGQAVPAAECPAGSLKDISVVVIEGEFRVASAGVRRFLAERAYVLPDAGVKARNVAEMRRRLHGVQTSGLEVAHG